MLKTPMLKYHATGRWLSGQVELRWTPSTYRSTSAIDAQIDAAWQQAKSRLGDKLFDGPMCRLEGRVQLVAPSAPTKKGGATSCTLRLLISSTSYRIFLGTNMTQPELADEFRANPVGVSTALITADNYLMLGRRNDNVAYYPRKLHPFAGALEPADSVDLFENALRELHEELDLSTADITEIACLGLVEDLKLRHPETILCARTRRNRKQIESQLHAEEHDSAWSCPATRNAIESALKGAEQFTPVAIAGMTLVSRMLSS